LVGPQPAYVRLWAGGGGEGDIGATNRGLKGGGQKGGKTVLRIYGTVYWDRAGIKMEGKKTPRRTGADLKKTGKRRKGKKNQQPLMQEKKKAGIKSEFQKVGAEWRGVCKRIKKESRLERRYPLNGGKTLKKKYFLTTGHTGRKFYPENSL